MNRLCAHIDELESLMQSKGFDGHFLCKGGHPGRLKDTLCAHLLEKLKEQRHVPPFFLTTYTHWTGEERPHVKCDFRMTHDSWLGFKVDKIEVTRANHGGTIKSIRLRPDSNESIPTREKLNTLVGQKARQLKR